MAVYFRVFQVAIIECILIIYQNSVDKVKTFVRDNLINYIRRVGRKSTSPRKLILTTDSYESKIKLLNNLENTEDFTNTAFITNLEKVQTKFFKLILTDMQVTMPFEQNWGNIQ